MHIAILTDGITPYVTGGMQRHSYHLIRSFLRQGVSITLVHTVTNDTEMPSQESVCQMLGANEDQLEVIGIPFPKKADMPGHYIRESYAFSCEIYQTLADRWSQFDFIYAKGFTAWCLLEKKKKGVHIAPVGIKFHGYEMFQKTRRLKTRLEQFMLKPPVVFMNRNADVVFSYGGEISNIIEKTGVDPEKIYEIGSGIDSSWLRDGPSSPNKPLKFLFIGRNERRKGIGELMTAARSISAKQAEFHWVGPISKQAHLNEDQHHFYGEITDPEKLKTIIDGCDVLVVPSHSEGMPNVILEAMARGLAIIATRVGAVPKMVSNDNGALIEPAQSRALKGALLDFVDMPTDELQLKKSASLTKVSTQFLWDEIGKETLQTIKEITHS